MMTISSYLRLLTIDRNVDTCLKNFLLKFFLFSKTLLTNLFSWFKQWKQHFWKHQILSCLLMTHKKYPITRLFMFLVSMSYLRPDIKVTLSYFSFTLKWENKLLWIIHGSYTSYTDHKYKTPHIYFFRHLQRPQIHVTWKVCETTI